MNQVLRTLPFEMVKFGDVATISRGISYSSAELTEDGKGRPLVNLRNVGKGGGFRVDGLKYYTGEAKERHSVLPGDLLIANTDLSKAKDVLGSPILIPHSFEIEEAVFSLDLTKLIIDTQKALVKYVAYFLESPSSRLFMKANGSGTTVMHLQLKALPELMMPLPSLTMQHQIVEILEDHLSRLDAALADVKQAKVKAIQFRTSYLRSVFIGTRDWSKIAMKDLGTWNGGGTPSKANSKFWTDGTVPWLSPKDMGPFEIKETQDKITESALSESTVKKIPPSSIVFVVRSGILERKLPIALTGIETTLNQDMKALTCNSQILPRFAMYALVAFEQDILTTCRKTGTTVASINTKALMNYSLNVPTSEIQRSILREIESQISLTDESAKYLENLASQGNRLRRSLLQAAFTGQLTREATHV